MRNNLSSNEVIFDKSALAISQNKGQNKKAKSGWLTARSQTSSLTILKFMVHLLSIIQVI